MRFLYWYKTKENEQRTGELSAASREEVYRLLRKDGIKAFKVELAPGLWNRIQTIGKRGFAIIALALALVVTLAVYLTSEEPASASFQTDQTRRQVIGDAAVIEKGIRTGWADIFELEGERFLASFAIPGVKAGQRNTTVEEIKASLDHFAAVSTDDGIEARQIKAMVEGMKRELRAYLAAGGTIIEYGKRLVERQDSEIAVYERTKNEIETAQKTLSAAELETLWEKRNGELRNLGIRLVALPE